MSEDFSNYLTDIINKASLSLMISIGHRTTLFDTMATMMPASAEVIAEKSGLNKRYVVEWLGSMVTGRIIGYNSDDRTYSLHKDKAKYLTRKNSIYDFSASMQWIPMLGQVEDKIIECFKSGGGVPYPEYNRFHEVMAEESAQTVVSGLLNFIVPLVQGLDTRLKEGIKVLDVGCGSGKALNVLAGHYPKSVFVGYDLSEEAILSATSEAAKLGNSNITFKVKNLLKEFPSEKFNLITAFDVIHDQPNPQLVLGYIQKSLSKDGIFLMQDILASSNLEDNLNHPLGPFLYTISCLHCMSVSLSQNGAGLGAMWGMEKAQELLKFAGFTDIQIKTLEHDFQNYYYICRK